MAALVLGKRSSSCFFEELQCHPAAGAATTPPPPPSACKRARFSPPRSWSSSSFPSVLGFSPLPTWESAAGAGSIGSVGSTPTPLGHLRSLFPDMDEQLLEKALEACGFDLDSAIKRLNDLRSGSPKGNLECAANVSAEDRTSTQPFAEGILGNSGGDLVSENPSDMNNIPADGSEWVELFVREMINATDTADATARTSRVLEFFEKSIMACACSKAVQSVGKENMMLKEQVEALLRDNHILKRAVAIQHERQKEFDERNKELQHLKQLVAQYQEQLRTLEINNYALSMHLRQTQQSSSIPGRFHPDVF